MAKSKSVELPGEEESASPAPIVAENVVENETSDVDEAIGLAQSGKARKIKKARIDPPPLNLKVPDPDRPMTAAVNTKRQMTYAEAMKLRTDGKLTRAVLTEQGWVPANDREPPRGVKV